MLWVKAFHIVFVASWFAGLFYLPRIYVNLAMVTPGSVAERERLLLMARKLLRFTTMLAVPAVGLGLWLWLGYGFAGGWLHAKLACCGSTSASVAVGCTPSWRWWRWWWSTTGCAPGCCNSWRPMTAATATGGFAGSMKFRCCC